MVHLKNKVNPCKMKSPFHRRLHSMLNDIITDGWAQDSLTTLWIYKSFKTDQYRDNNEIEISLERWLSNLTPESYTTHDLAALAIYVESTGEMVGKFKEMISKECQKENVSTEQVSLERASVFDTYLYCYLIARVLKTYEGEWVRQAIEKIKEKSYPSGLRNKLFLMLAKYFIGEEDIQSCILTLIRNGESPEISKSDLIPIFYCTQKFINLASQVEINKGLLKRSQEFKKNILNRIYYEFPLVSNTKGENREKKAYTPLQLAMLDDIFGSSSTVFLRSKDEMENLRNNLKKEVRYKHYFKDFWISRIFLTSLPLLPLFLILDFFDLPLTIAVSLTLTFVVLSIILFLLNLRSFSLSFDKNWTKVEETFELVNLGVVTGIDCVGILITVLFYIFGVF